MFKKTQAILETNENVKKLVSLLESNEVKQLRKDSAELKEIKSLLAHVKFKIKDVRVVDNPDSGKTNIVVVYELPRIVLELDDSGRPNKNDFFYATNRLDMISLEDMSSFQTVLRNAQNRRKK